MEILAVDPGDLTFEDALALEYYMLNVNAVLDASKDEGEERFLENLVLLAASSYAIAKVFRITKEKQAALKEKNSEEEAEEEKDV